MQRYYRYLLLALALLTGAAQGAAPDGPATDKTLAPYFFVHSDDPTLDRLPLEATEVDVRIAGVIAEVHVTQHYRNAGKRPIEAEYVFPGSTRAAVYGLKMSIGERTVVARIRERQQARAEYQAAKTAGKSAALLEQQRPNVFQMSVANILPGDRIRVDLSYTELLVPTESVYQFVFPTVVGPRYTTRTAAEAEPSARWTQNPYLREGEEPTSDFKLHLALDAGMPVKTIGSPSHRVDVRYEGPERALVDLAADERAGLGHNRGNDRDFILDYRLAGDAVESGLLLYEGPEENFFLALVEPPRRVAPAQVPPRDYLFVVDVSGSMHGFPLDTAKALLRDLVGHLRPTDSFNVLLFSGGSAVLSESPLPASPDNLSRATAFIDAQQGGGGTELLPALRRALALPGAEGRARGIVVVTDGYVDVETETLDLIRASLGRASLFAFGIGSSVNRFLIEGMARAGQGEPFIVTGPQQAAARAEAFRRYIEAPVLTGIRLDFEGLDAYDVEPLSVPDLLASRPLAVFGKWRGERRGTLRLQGTSGEGAYERRFDLTTVMPSPDHAALRYLWARQRIGGLADYQRVASDPQRVAEITRLGLKYSLLTAYTSFVAVDEVVRNASPGGTETVRQPLPLPAGVSDLAVGGQVPTTPEPEIMVLIAAAGALAAWQRRRGKRRAS